MNLQTITSTAQKFEMPFFTVMRRIIIIGPKDLLDQAVTRLLMIRADLEVIQADDSNLDELTKITTQIQPDVIILCHTEQTLQNGLVAMLECNPALSGVRIIIVHPLNNKLDVYDHHQWFSADHFEFFPLVYTDHSGILQ